MYISPMQTLYYISIFFISFGCFLWILKEISPVLHKRIVDNITIAILDLQIFFFGMLGIDHLFNLCRWKLAKVYNYIFFDLDGEKKEINISFLLNLWTLIVDFCFKLFTNLKKRILYYIPIIYEFLIISIQVIIALFIKSILMTYTFLKKLGLFYSFILIFLIMCILIDIWCMNQTVIIMHNLSESHPEKINQDFALWCISKVCVIYSFLFQFLFHSICILLLGLILYVPLLLGVAWFTLQERKGLALLQRRRGPNVIGYLGILQPIADALKLLTKEFILPTQSNYFLFTVAPVISMLCAFIGWLFIPFNDLGSLITINLPIMFLLAVSSIGVYGIIFAGWASNSQYPFLGSLRSTAQMISYELVMGIVILCICLLSESFSLVEIVEAQRDIWFFFVQAPIFFIFLFAAVAETNRPPLDEAEAESEIVSGYNTDFGAVGFTIFFISEYSNVILMSAMMVVLFFGGWLPPMFLSSFSTPLWCSFWFSIKTICVMSLFVWARASFPRLRYDQLMTLTWKRLLPLSLSCLVAVAIGVWISR